MKPIQIFTTGGTIDKVYFDAKSEYEVGEPQITEILNEAGATHPFRVEALFRKDSLDLTERDRQIIVERVLQSDSDRIIITHGTDTMVETARQLEPSNHRTVVLVGSLSPARFKNSDAVFNIGFAFAAVQTLTPGVYIAMNGRVFPADRVRKNRELNRFEAA